MEELEGRKGKGDRREEKKEEEERKNWRSR